MFIDFCCHLLLCPFPLFGEKPLFSPQTSSGSCSWGWLHASHRGCPRSQRDRWPGQAWWALDVGPSADGWLGEGVSCFCEVIQSHKSPSPLPGGTWGVKNRPSTCHSCESGPLSPGHMVGKGSCRPLSIAFCVPLWCRVPGGEWRWLPRVGIHLGPLTEQGLDLFVIFLSVEYVSVGLVRSIW